MAFDVTVEKAIRNITEGETVRILSICYFTDDDKFNGYLRDYFPDKGLMLLENPYAFFSTLPTIIPSYPPPPQINGEIIDLSPYADFCDSGIYETDGDGFYFFSSRIDFSEIQPDSAE